MKIKTNQREERLERRDWREKNSAMSERSEERGGKRDLDKIAPGEHSGTRLAQVHLDTLFLLDVTIFVKQVMGQGLSTLAFRAK